MTYFRAWILEQNYSLYDTYGEEFGDLIADIPDPTALPLALLADFISILDDLGEVIIFIARNNQRMFRTLIGHIENVRIRFPHMAHEKQKA